MSPELETLDQLLCEALPLRTIRGLFPTTEAFNTAMQWMLSCGDVRLFDDKGKNCRIGHGAISSPANLIPKPPCSCST